MRAALKGLHSVRKRLSSGLTATYHYAWRGGPRIIAKPGTAEFVAEYGKHIHERGARGDSTLATLVAEYRMSAEYLKRRERTRLDYARYLKLIETKFGDMPIEALDDPRVRGDFKEWRDSMVATPRKADLAWTILARVLFIAKDRGRIKTNPCERGGRLYTPDRTDAIWTADLIEKVLTGFPTRLRSVFMVALYTGQRQGDILRLPWSAYDGKRIKLKQGKTGRRVSILAAGVLRAEIASLPRLGPIMLTSTDKRPWTSDGFRASWGAACRKAGISGVTFHDIRGSAVTRFFEAKCTVAEIATITGHSLRDVEAILDAHYFSRTDALGDSAVRKRERKERRTKPVNRPVNRDAG
jgi:integrase